MHAFRRLGAVALASIAIVAGLTAIAPSTTVAAPVSCTGHQFADTFDGSPGDAVHHYGLNARLESRQTGGGALSTYTRRSGSQTTSVVPPETYVQANRGGTAANKLSFWTGTSAVRLDTAVAPNPDPASPTYVVRATLDPIADDTTSNNWLSIMLAGARNNNGSIFESGINFGLVVRSNGGLAVYEAGVAKTVNGGNVPAAPSYDVTLIVNQATGAVTLVINGAERTAQLTQTVPSMAYLFIGSYFGFTSPPVTSSTKSTVNDLCVQTMNGFTDSFNTGDVDPVDANSYLLNTELDSRQQLNSQMSYTNVHGALSSARVNATYARDVLSFRGGNSVVRLNAPAAADPLSKTYRVRAVLDPITGDTASDDWVSLVLSAAKNTNGWVTNPAVDFAFNLRSDGRFSVRQRNMALTVSPDPELSPAPTTSGAFDTTILVGAGANRTATFRINGATYTAVLTQELAPQAYLYTGAYHQSGTNTSTVNDLRLNRVTKYYGFYGAVWPDRGTLENELGSTYTPSLDKAGNYNLNVIHLQTGADYTTGHQAVVNQILSGCRVAGCVVSVTHVFFTFGKPWTLQPNYDVLWDVVTRYIALSVLPDGSRGADRIMGFNIDEPYLHEASQADLTTAVDAIKCYQLTSSYGCVNDLTTFRNASAVIQFNSAEFTTGSPVIPKRTDIVGFDYYCAYPGTDVNFDLAAQRTELVDRLQKLRDRRSDPAQRIILFPEARTGKACEEHYSTADHGDGYFERTQREYAELMLSEPAAAGMMTFGQWLEFSCSDGPVPTPPCDAGGQYEPTPVEYDLTWATMHLIGRATNLEGNL